MAFKCENCTGNVGRIIIYSAVIAIHRYPYEESFFLQWQVSLQHQKVVKIAFLLTLCIAGRLSLD